MEADGEVERKPKPKVRSRETCEERHETAEGVLDPLEASVFSKMAPLLADCGPESESSSMGIRPGSPVGEDIDESAGGRFEGDALGAKLRATSVPGSSLSSPESFG